MTHTPVNRFWFTGVCVVLVVLLLPGTAFAHGAEGLRDTDYRVSITQQPELSDVEVRVVEAGWRLELRVSGQRRVEILGYSGEPYAEVTPDGVYVNTNSPAVYLNETAESGGTAPEWASPAASPNWELAHPEPVFRWHDHRTNWMNSEPPPAVAADPGKDHRIAEWAVPLRTGTERHEVTGTLDWLAPPATANWIAGALLTGAALVALSLRQGRAPRIALATVAAGGAAAVLASSVGRALVAADMETGWPEVLLVNQGWAVMAAVSTCAAAVYTWWRGEAAELALGIAGIALALLGGVARFTALRHALTPTPWDPEIERTIVTSAIGVGTALAVAALLSARHTGGAGHEAA